MRCHRRKPAAYRCDSPRPPTPRCRAGFRTSRQRLGRALISTTRKRAEQSLALTGPEALTDSEAADVIGAAIGRTVRYVDLPPEQLAGGMRSSGAPDWLVESIVALEGVKANGWAAEVSPVVESVLGEKGERLSNFVARNAGVSLIARWMMPVRHGIPRSHVTLAASAGQSTPRSSSAEGAAGLKGPPATCLPCQWLSQDCSR